MELEETFVDLFSKIGQLRQENDQLKAGLCSALQENRELRAKMQSINHDRTQKFIDGSLEEFPNTSTSARMKQSSQLLKTCDEKQFRQDLERAKVRTSSPVDFKSYVLNSVLTHTTAFQSPQPDTPPEVKGKERILGEIAYQLDRRILSYIFQGHRQFYGFTLLNIPHKIIEVSTHPLTGKVDEGYRLHLIQRYNDLFESLKQFGYKGALHPTLSEFVVNTYGILAPRSSDNIDQTVEFNDPEFLRRCITVTAPRQLEKELLIFLTCLCHMAEKDEKPLIFR